ncbi:MAG: hypothetical protein HY036_10200 [Nitrospirae bacterium]|nr:hypothetical protein [Nitrospirota bacterium]MBI3352936.1 hypothetical protein [Nitrospirota bacterium]
MPEEPKKGEQPPKKPISLSIPLIKVPNEAELLEEELQDMFDEDKVTHKHGNSEPESD